MTNALLDWRSIADEREKYAAYLCSPEWGTLRGLVKERAGNHCERCRAADISHVHHLTYIRKYRELPSDLQGLCEGCHKFIHGLSKTDPCKSQRARWRKELEAATDYKRIRELIRKLTIG